MKKTLALMIKPRARWLTRLLWYTFLLPRSVPVTFISRTGNSETWPVRVNRLIATNRRKVVFGDDGAGEHFVMLRMNGRWEKGDRGQNVLKS